VLRPPHEEVLSAARRGLALVAAVAALTSACAAVELAGSRAAPARSAASLRSLPPLDDPVDRARFECAVEVQRAQGFDPGASLSHGSLIGAVVGGAPGAALGALFGLVGDIPGRGAGIGAIVGGGLGITLGGLITLRADGDAYERGLAECVAARAAGTRAPPFAPPAAGLVEYRLRLLNVRHTAFTSFLAAAELGEGASGPGLLALVDAAAAGALPRGAVLYDRHVAPAPEPVALAWGATPVADARVKLGGGGRDFWDDARWYGRPGERTVWVVTARARRPQEIRRLALGADQMLAHFRPLPSPMFGRRLEPATAVGLGYLQHAEQRAEAAAYARRHVDLSRGIAAVVAVNDDLTSPDRAYLVVTHAAGAATYEAVMAWASRGIERESVDTRD
jgi:hypothetical protein